MSLSPSIFNVTAFGAVGAAIPCEELVLRHRVYKYLTLPEGLTYRVYRLKPGAVLDSGGIQAAIDAAFAAGGGTVWIPPGNYLIAPLRLRSRVRLHLEPGACLWGSPDLPDYDRPAGEAAPEYSHEQGYNRNQRGLNAARKRLIHAENEEDVFLSGEGQISGQAPAWAIPWMNGGALEKVADRPGDTVLFHRCRNVKVEGICLIDTPSWSLVFDLCEHVQVRGIRIRCFDIINADGIDLVNTSHVAISDCDLHTMDDAICLKSTMPDFTLHSVVVTNCVIRTLCNALKIGTDSLGHFEDIAFSNIVVRNDSSDILGAKGGINLCSLDGGSIRNVSFSNIVTQNTDCPFYLVSGKRSVQQEKHRPPRSGVMEGISVIGLTAHGARHPCFVVGQPDQPIRDVMLQNIRVRKAHGFYEEVPAGPVPERPEQYPTPFMFASRAQGDGLPACGLFLRHAERIVVRDFIQENEASDARELLVAENCRDLEVSGAKLHHRSVKAGF